jgi:hypothetical protein
VAAGSWQEQQQRGFVSAFYGMSGSTCFAGYDSYISNNFGKAPPGVAMVKHLLAGGTVNTLPVVDMADTVTKARFRSYVLRGGSTLSDWCQYMCSGDPCPAPPACAAGELLCNALTGTCDTSCCDKQDGNGCTIRGEASTCEGGKCKGERAVLS